MQVIYVKLRPRREYFKVQLIDNDVNEASEQKYAAESSHFR